jgi:hypothetical protein
MESNNTTVLTAPGLTVLAKTPGGAAFVKKVTHPPTTIPNDYCGVPDSSAPNVVLMETKGESNFPPILSFPSSKTAAIVVNSDKMMFLSPSGGKVASYCFIWNPAPPTGYQAGWVQPINYAANGAGDFPKVSNICPAAALNSGYNWANWLVDVSQNRTTYKSETYYLNATNFNNQGTVTTCKFKPNVTYASSFTTLFVKHEGDKLSDRNLDQFLSRHVHKTASKNVKFDDDDGYDVITPASKVSGYTSNYAIQVLEIDSPNANIGNLFGSPQYTFNQVLPDTASDVLTMSSKAVTRPASEGNFCVHQPVNPFYEWISSSTASDKIAPAKNGPVISILRTKVGTTYYYVPLYSDSTVVDNSNPGSVGYTTDTPWNNLDWTITLFDGLTTPPTVGTTLTSVPYITVKSFNGHELQPQFYGSIRPFSRLLPPPDRDALDIATTIFHGREDGLPASANDLGTIASVALKYLPTAVGFLKNLFGGSARQEKAMKQAREFVSPKSNNKGGNRSRSQSMSRQISSLTNAVSKMAMTREPASRLPNYGNSSQVGFNPNMPKPKPLMSIKTKAPKARSRSRSASRSRTNSKSRKSRSKSRK